LLIIFALALVVYAPQWNFTDLCIELAIAGYIATFITGVFVLGPSAEKIDRLIASGQAPDEPRCSHWYAARCAPGASTSWCCCWSCATWC
jgi:hypothetical protein